MHIYIYMHNSKVIPVMLYGANTLRARMTCSIVFGN